MIIIQIKKGLKKLANPNKAKILQRFFKTGPGEYGAGDIFLGVTMPQQRLLAKQYINVPLREIQQLLNSRVHEERMTALLILTYQYPVADPKTQQRIFQFYLKNTHYINNWDLVDVTCPNIVGEYLLSTSAGSLQMRKNILYQLAKSKNLWERRIAIVSTYAFIKNNQFFDTLKISEILLKDKHDLIHKAVGWMLREVGKRDQKVEESFLKHFHTSMPRTMLRYSLERFSPAKKRFYMSK